MDFDFLQKRLSFGCYNMVFGRDKTSFCFDSMSVLIKSFSTNSTITLFFDSIDYTYAYKKLGDIRNIYGNSRVLIDYFVKSLKHNKKAMELIERNLKEAFAQTKIGTKLAKLIEPEISNIEIHNEEISFWVSDLFVFSKKASNSRSIFKMIYPDDFFDYNVDTYNVFHNISQENVKKAFLFGLKYTNNYDKRILKYICDRSEDWIKKKGM